MNYRNFLAAMLFSISVISIAYSETVAVSPTGEYKTIDTTEDNALMTKLGSSNSRDAESAYQEVIANLDAHNPVVVCAAGVYLFRAGDKIGGYRLYVIGRLRVIFDIRRCTDTTVRDSVQVLDNAFGPTFQEWFAGNLDTYISTNLGAIEYFSKHEEAYDQRWINLRGMRAMNEGLGGKPDSEPLSVSKDQWAQIKSDLVSSQNDFFRNYETNYFISRFGRTSSSYFLDPGVREFARATAKGDISAAKRLLDSGIGVDSVGVNGVTPLVWTIGARNAKGAEFLLKNGANPNITYEKGLSLLSTTTLLGDEALLSLLFQYGAKFEAIGPDLSTDLVDKAVIYSSVSTSFLEKMLQNGGNAIGKKGFEGQTLYSAVIGNDYKKANVLIRYGAGTIVSENLGSLITKAINRARDRFGSDPDFISCVKRLSELKVLGN